jgi:hypothetical protein
MLSALKAMSAPVAIVDAGRVDALPDELQLHRPPDGGARRVWLARLRGAAVGDEALVAQELATAADVERATRLALIPAGVCDRWLSIDPKSAESATPAP